MESLKGSGRSKVEKERPLIIFCKMMACEIDRLNGSVGIIRDVTDRLVGAEPENEKVSEDTPIRQDGEYGDLDQMLCRLRKAVDVLGYESARQSDRV